MMVMSSEKYETPEGNDKRIRVIVETHDDPATDTAAKVEVLSLSIDEDFDLGGDPYNRTGQFVALELDERDFD